MKRYMIGGKSVVIGGDTVLYGDRVGKLSVLNKLAKEADEENMALVEADEKKITFEQVLEGATKPLRSFG